MARTPGQVGSIGTAIMLTFGILGGSFIQTSIMPGWFQVFSKIIPTPGAWTGLPHWAWVVRWSTWASPAWTGSHGRGAVCRIHPDFNRRSFAQK